MEEIMAIAYAGIHELDGGWLFPNSDYYTEAGLDAYNQADLEVARAFLEKSDYDGETLTFITDNLRPNVDTATVVQQRLAQIGVNVEQIGRASGRERACQYAELSVVAVSLTQETHNT